MKNLFIASILLLLSAAATAQNNYAVSFNGSAEADCGNASGLNITGTALTVEAWIYPTAFTTNFYEGSIVAKDASTNQGYVLRCGGSGVLSFVIGVTGNVWVDAYSANNVLSLNKWQHVAGVYNGTTVKIFVNGQQVQSVNENRSILSDNSLHLGIGHSFTAWAPARNFTGNIDEVRIWNVAKSQSALLADMFKHVSSGTGLVASYQMSDGSGSSLTDNSGNGNTATLSAGTSWVASPVAFSGNALAFDGTNDIVQIPHHTSHEISAAITVEAWIYATSTSTVQDVLTNSSSATNTGYVFPRTDDGWSHVTFWLNIGGSWVTLSAPYPSLNSWHHLAGTYDGATMKIYIDGILAASQAQTGTIVTNSNPLILGNQPGFPEYFGGSADELRVWNTARSQAQIQADMYRELDPALSSGLVAYYTVNQGIAAGTNTGLTTLIDQTGNSHGTLTSFSLTGTTSNYVTQPDNLVILPLQWLTFTVHSEQTEAVLKWTSVNEQQLQNYAVQYSNDGLVWTTIGIVTAAGDGAYSYRHPLHKTGTHYYRIRENDLNGNYSFSPVCRLQVNEPMTGVRIFPNPVTNGLLFIQSELAGAVSLYDLAGRRVKTWQKNAGLVNLYLGGVKPGVYQLRLSAESVVTKIILQ